MESFTFIVAGVPLPVGSHFWLKDFVRFLLHSLLFAGIKVVSICSNFIKPYSLPTSEFHRSVLDDLFGGLILHTAIRERERFKIYLTCREDNCHTIHSCTHGRQLRRTRSGVTNSTQLSDHHIEGALDKIWKGRGHYALRRKIG